MHHRPMTCLLVCCAGLCAGLQSATALAREADAQLPIREITLYRSGVGSFLRQGTVEGDAQAQLTFDASQVNDILKSMLLLDLDGGRIDTVRYDSDEPLSRRLASFGVNIADSPSVGEMFRRLRGAGLRVTTPDGELEGTILGVETRPRVHASGERPVVVNEEFVTLTTPQGVRTVPVTDISIFELSDEELAGELRLALHAINEQRDERLKSVELGFSGPADSQRRVVVGYVHEMPVWKTSYRLVLPEEGGSPTIQGWAIVENTTDADWQDVRLSLASGRPVGFTMDLYEPIFAPRPNVPVPVAGGMRPRTYESGKATFAGKRSDLAGAQVESRRRLGRAADMVSSQLAMTEASDMAQAPLLEADEAIANLAASQATAGEVGEQFMYTVEAPVTLERKRSAMLPILTSSVQGRRVSVFHPHETPRHPMRGVEISNDTGLHLMPGPLSVYDGATYAGDAQIPHTSRGQKRLMAYALDLDVHVSPEVTSDQTVSTIRIVDGLLHKTIRQSQTRTYSLSNYDAARERTVIIEEPRNAGWELIEPAEPMERTDDLYRFEVGIDASGAEVFEVEQEITRWERVDVTSVSLETLLSYQRNGKVSREVVDAVRKALGMQSKINRIDRRIAELDRERDAITRDQDRIRSNLGRVDRSSDLGRRYLAKLATQEDRLETMSDERAQSQKEREAEQRSLNSYLKDLDVS